ncbi:hypothetical protein PO124_29735 [Bacillus licheniformis]|nr:hypothetical protein [Bacillus licheniformis]
MTDTNESWKENEEIDKQRKHRRAEKQIKSLKKRLRNAIKY